MIECYKLHQVFYLPCPCKGQTFTLTYVVLNSTCWDFVGKWSWNLFPKCSPTKAFTSQFHLVGCAPTQSLVSTNISYRETETPMAPWRNFVIRMTLLVNWSVLANSWTFPYVMNSSSRRKGPHLCNGCSTCVNLVPDFRSKTVFNQQVFTQCLPCLNLRR